VYGVHKRGKREEKSKDSCHDRGSEFPFINELTPFEGDKLSGFFCSRSTFSRSFLTISRISVNFDQRPGIPT
jgi:hypothetical protein